MELGKNPGGNGRTFIGALVHDKIEPGSVWLWSPLPGPLLAGMKSCRKPRPLYHLLVKILGHGVLY